MKTKIAIASAFIAASSFSTAEIVVNDFLSFEGFVDMSYSHIQVEDDFAAQDIESENSFQIDQVEISWLFDFDPVTAQIDLQYEDLPGDTTAVEQAFVTYHFDNGGAITAGRYASMLGFEAFEPTGLYQYSTAYSIQNYDGAVTVDGYAQGVKYTQEGESTFFGISLQDEAFEIDTDRLGGNGESSYAVEIAGAYYMDNGLSFFLGGAYEDADAGDTYALNTYVTFETGAWIFAAELNYINTERGIVETDNAAGNDEDGFSGLLMANFAYSDQASLTGRFSYIQADEDGTSDDHQYFKYTVAHSYAFTDNLLLVTEFSYVDGERISQDYNELFGAVELLFTF